MGTKHELKNRYMHVDYVDETEGEKTQSASSKISKCQNDTLNDTLEITLDELAILNRIVKNPMITQNELAGYTGKSIRTIKRKMNELKEKGYIRRMNGKRDGKWEILVDISEK